MIIECIHYPDLLNNKFSSLLALDFFIKIFTIFIRYFSEKLKMILDYNAQHADKHLLFKNKHRRITFLGDNITQSYSIKVILEHI